MYQGFENIIQTLLRNAIELNRGTLNRWNLNLNRENALKNLGLVNKLYRSNHLCFVCISHGKYIPRKERTLQHHRTVLHNPHQLINS